MTYPEITAVINPVSHRKSLPTQPAQALLPPAHNPAIYLFQPQQRLLLVSPRVLAIHGFQQTEACIAMSRLLSCYLPADSNKLKLAFQVAAAIRGCLTLTVQTKSPELLIEHKLQRLQYGDRCFLCAQLKTVDFFRNYY